MPRASDDIAFALGIAIGIGVLMGTGVHHVRVALIPSNDFSYVWAGARAVLDGVDPYDAERFPALVERYGAQPGKERDFIYPPWVVGGLVPLGALPLRAASEIWTFGSLALAVFALWALVRAVAPGRPATATLAALSLVVSQPGIVTYWSGQWGFLHTAALAAASTSIIRGGRGTLGALALLGKPHVLGAAFIGLLPALIARSRPREAAVLAATAVVLVIVPILALPGWLPTIAPDLGPRLAGQRWPTTIYALLQEALGPVGLVVAAGIVGGAVVALTRIDPARDAWLAVVGALSVAAAPYAWTYDHLALVVPLTIAAGLTGARVSAVAFGAFLLVPTLLTIPADFRRSETWSAVVPFLVLAFCLVVARPSSTRHRPVAPGSAS